MAKTMLHDTMDECDHSGECSAHSVYTDPYRTGLDVPYKTPDISVSGRNGRILWYTTSPGYGS